MEFAMYDSGGFRAAALQGDGVFVASVQDALDMMAESGMRAIIVRDDQLAPEFFRLGSGLAGEILQKFTNYRVRFAVVGDFSKYPGKPLRDFIRESNATGQVLFVADATEALGIWKRADRRTV
ncbi:MAG: DUF4180 domain-containing protein [Rectinema sp.]